MSDGNFNRSLLPYHNYQSGVRAGRASMRTLAVQAFEHWLRENEDGITDEAVAEQVRQFKARLG